MPRENVHNPLDAIRVDKDHLEKERQNRTDDKSVLIDQVLDHRDKQREEGLENRARGAAA